MDLTFEEIERLREAYKRQATALRMVGVDDWEWYETTIHENFDEGVSSWPLFT